MIPRSGLRFGVLSEERERCTDYRHLELTMDSHREFRWCVIDRPWVSMGCGFLSEEAAVKYLVDDLGGRLIKPRAKKKRFEVLPTERYNKRESEIQDLAVTCVAGCEDVNFVNPMAAARSLKDLMQTIRALRMEIGRISKQERELCRSLLLREKDLVRVLRRMMKGL